MSGQIMQNLLIWMEQIDIYKAFFDLCRFASPMAIILYQK